MYQHSGRCRDLDLEEQSVSFREQDLSPKLSVQNNQFVAFISCSFLLLQKRTKKAGPKSMYNPIPALALIKLLYYCGEQQCSPDARIKFNIVSFFPLSVSDTVSLLSGKS